MRFLRKLLRSKTADAKHAFRGDRIAPAAGPLSTIAADAQAHTEAGRFAQALSSIDAALATRPDDTELQFARSATLSASGRWREAHVAARRAAAAGPPHSKHFMLLGSVCFRAGDLAGAEAWFAKAMAAEPEASEPRFNLAATLHAQNRTGEATAAYERALRLNPGHFDSLMGLGNCALERGDFTCAETQFRRAIAVDGERAIAWRYLGQTFDRQDREAEALEAHGRAVQLETAHGENVGAFLALAASLRDAARFEEARAVLEPNLQRRPGAEAQVIYAQMLLAVGRLREGWHHNEFRWMTEHFLQLRPNFGRPVWSGQDLRGKTILLHAEQGLGDDIQFVRYAPHIKALGGTVLLLVPPVLRALMRSVAGIDRVLALGADGSVPDFDYYAHLLSLPNVFGTDLATIPAETPYLRVDPERAARWSQRLGEVHEFSVGLVWAGNPMHPGDRYRSMSLGTMAPLGTISGVRFFSLQKGAHEEDANTPPAGMALENLAPELDDLSDTAAVISQLDLVICVDTAVAHLAGALGKPVWLMIARSCDWRWLEGRDDSPWYPSARLFRQTRRGEWADVIDRVKEALESEVRNGGIGIPLHAAVKGALTSPVAASPGAPSGYRPGFSAVAETRVGILEYFPDDAPIGASIGWYGEWLQPQLDLLKGMIHPGSTLIEVGSGIGVHAVFLGSATGATGHLLIYESRPPMQRVLRQNLVANRVAQVTIMRRRLGRRSKVNSREDGERSPSDAAAPAPSDDIATETLDDLRLERLDWLKINDGVAALDILEGAAESLWRLRPSLFISVAERSLLDRLANALREFGYRCWRHETALFSQANFNRREDDLFAGRTAVALLAIPEEAGISAALDGCVELA